MTGYQNFHCITSLYGQQLRIRARNDSALTGWLALTPKMESRKTQRPRRRRGAEAQSESHFLCGLCAFASLRFKSQAPRAPIAARPPETNGKNRPPLAKAPAAVHFYSLRGGSPPSLSAFMSSFSQPANS